MGTHYFYALALEDEIKKELGVASEELQKALPFQRWVHPLDLHVTLAFLGDAEKQSLEESISLISSSWQQTSFSLEISHLGVFGAKLSPRILWAGGPKQAELDETRDVVFKLCAAAGFQLETRPFAPHITLARKWAGDGPFSMENLKIHNPFKEKSLKFKAKKMVLYQTNVNKVPKYEELQSFYFNES